jgi:hypothetical protein
MQELDLMLEVCMVLVFLTWFSNGGIDHRFFRFLVLIGT